ncbi:hypothetical protein [uncultured Photobacterium sp.]|uniref:hypothetical protein n=1 Tax=uncultured Photobacterium sp. TaxID=173973 RepID=UPI00260D8298|nr:hypothetical protein [uncultured Photobacterium sp.]
MRDNLPVIEASCPMPDDGLIPREFLDEYNSRVCDAYNRLLQDLIDQIQSESVEFDYKLDEGKIKLDISNEDEIDEDEQKRVKNQFKVITGRCGARCSAASKTLQAKVHVWHLQSRVDRYGDDITPAVANQLAKHVIGRGIALAQRLVFNKPGRSAANKSRLNIHGMEPDAFPPVINEIINELYEYQGMTRGHIIATQLFYRDQWNNAWQQTKEILSEDISNDDCDSCSNS